MRQNGAGGLRNVVTSSHPHSLFSFNSAADALADGTNASLRRSVGASHTPVAGKKPGSVLGGRPAAVTPAAAAARTPAGAAAARTPAGAAAAAAATTPGGGAAALPSPGSAAFAARAGSGEAIASYAPDGAAPLPAPAPGAPPPRVEAAALAPAGPPAPAPGAAPAGGGGGAHLLTDSLTDRADLLESRIASFAAAFETATGVAPTAPVGVALQAEDAAFAGRVVCEGGGGDGGGGAAPAPGGGRLNAASIVLEGSAALSSGGRVRLDVSKLVGPGGAGYRLFPGQAAVVRGACPAGHTLVASALHTSLPLPPAASPRSTLARFAASTGPAGMHVLVASGPYTPPDGDGLDYSPLDAILEAAAGGGGGGSGAAASPPSSSSPSSRPADALILLGPFVDAAHPAWTSPDAPDATFADIFAGQVVSRLAAFAEARAAAGAASHVPPILLVPSVRDATGLPTFPSPPLALPAGTPACVHALPNPATFRLNEVLVGATASDPLFAIAGCEAGAGPGGGVRGDRMGGLAGALLEQRCFYPAYPPAPGACLDARRARGCGGVGASSGPAGLAFPGEASPDVLLLPSDLAPFARLATAAAPAPAAGAEPAAAVKAVAVNPGRAVRPGGGGGSVAWLDVAPLLPPSVAADAGDGDDEGLAMDLDGAAGAAVLPHAVEGRARVEVVRL